jgi:hypothetical protein
MDTTAPIPGVAQITYPDGTSEFKYTDELEAALVRAEAASYAPVVQPQPAAQPITIQIVGAQPNLPAVPAERRPLVEPWMVRGAAGLGLAGGAAALAPVVAEAAASFSAALGSLLHIALQVGGIGLAALVLVRLLAGRKTGSTGGVEVIQTVTQTITNTVRIEK